ncbi:MAG: PEP-CTERM sorting domain-containing protein [Phycisphaerales bacterium]|nr:PEP-CTERM sorting domain-containing protein [Phycisphaerales bacterium]
MKNSLCVSACLLLGMTVCAAPAKSDVPDRSIEWKVQNVASGLDTCMAVLVQGNLDLPNSPIPFVYWDNGNTLLGGGGQIDGISFLGELESPVSIDVHTWGAPNGLDVLNPDYWAAAGRTGDTQSSGEGVEGHDIDYVPYYLLVFNTDSVDTATQYAVVTWGFNPGQPIDLTDGGKPDGNPFGNQYVTFDVGSLNWTPITATPEPASLSLLGLGAAAMIARRRK